MNVFTISFIKRVAILGILSPSSAKSCVITRVAILEILSPSSAKSCVPACLASS